MAYSWGTLVRLVHLKWRRLERGLTLEELGHLCGLSRKSLSYLERGIREPRPSTILRLARALGCEPAELMEPEAHGD